MSTPGPVMFPDEPPVFDGADLEMRFIAEFNGARLECAITAEALEDHFGAASALEDDLRQAFERGRERIHAVCADLLATTGEAVVLHSGQLRAAQLAAGIVRP